MSALQIWNGRCYGWYFGDRQVRCIHAAANSRADLVRLLASLGYHINDREVREFWSPCWGIHMAGVTPERGVWVQFRNEHYDVKPVRVLAEGVLAP